MYKSHKAGFFFIGNRVSMKAAADIPGRRAKLYYSPEFYEGQDNKIILNFIFDVVSKRKSFIAK